MTSYRVRYTPVAAARIRKLHPDVKREIKAGIRNLCDRPLEGRPLQYELSGYRSYRIRIYRVIYRLNEEETSVDIIFVGPRRDIYEELRTYLLSQHPSHN
jgi:mRNA-degrading endonuclease RelE of RelBE toxin-antitoxin system